MHSIAGCEKRRMFPPGPGHPGTLQREGGKTTLSRKRRPHRKNDAATRTAATGREARPASRAMHKRPARTGSGTAKGSAAFTFADAGPFRRVPTRGRHPCATPQARCPICSRYDVSRRPCKENLASRPVFRRPRPEAARPCPRHRPSRQASRTVAQGCPGNRRRMERPPGAKKRPFPKAGTGAFSPRDCLEKTRPTKRQVKRGNPGRAVRR